MAQEELTPLLKQYYELKESADGALLLFRMGDFYELFGDDAVTASKVLGITLTSRDKGKENPLPMAGVPHHSMAPYLQKLLAAGFKVAIGEQLEDPETKIGKGIVKRGIVRTFTPAVNYDLSQSDPVFLATAFSVPKKNEAVLACLDPSTGEVISSLVLSDNDLLSELSSLPIKHFIVQDSKCDPALIENIRARLAPNTLFEVLPQNQITDDQIDPLLRNQYKMQSLDAYLPEKLSRHAVALLIQYCAKSQTGEKSFSHLQLPRPLLQVGTVKLGPNTAIHLDLISTGDGTNPNLYHFLNKTRSAPGARELKRQILAPLQKCGEITLRQEALKELAYLPGVKALHSALSELYDLERICGRINAGLANPRDTYALGKSLGILPGLVSLLGTAKSKLLIEQKSSLQSAYQELEPLCSRILKNQKEDAPILSREGGIFNRGVTPELDRLIDLTENGDKWLIEFEAREKEVSGISSLKVKYNRVFGYFIEITTANLKNTPSHYLRKQTTVGGERFFTEELKKFEEERVTATFKLKSLEQQLFDELIQDIQEKIPALMKLAHTLATLDVEQSLATFVDQPGWVFPSLDDSLEVAIEMGRHPVVDEASRGAFVPNSLTFASGDDRVLLITGPNMGGKSTVMRQNALIVLLGQMGAPVPAKKAHWGVFSSIYTRIGAHDAIARGQSTFMVEMNELGHILHHADERSLIILDEVGRGTSTFDGISVAWATLEWISKKIGARTLFATHYHELTKLESTLPGVRNAHMAVESEKKSNFRFLYELKPGPANESFGIHVAKLAGLPAPLIDRAWKVLDELESQSKSTAATPYDPNQMSLFSGPSFAEPKTVEVAPEWSEGLRQKNLNEMTPLQALTYLNELQEKAKS